MRHLSPQCLAYVTNTKEKHAQDHRTDKMVYWCISIPWPPNIQVLLNITLGTVTDDNDVPFVDCLGQAVGGVGRLRHQLTRVTKARSIHAIWASTDRTTDLALKDKTKKKVDKILEQRADSNFAFTLWYFLTRQLAIRHMLFLENIGQHFYLWQ